MGTRENKSSTDIKTYIYHQSKEMMIKTNRNPVMRDFFSDDFMAPFTITFRTEPLFRFPIKESSGWKEEMEIEIMPTEAQDLTINVNHKEKTMTISGKSETVKESASNNFKSTSIHQWERTMTFPVDIDPESIKVKQLKNKSTLQITSQRKEPTTEECMIPVTIE